MDFRELGVEESLREGLRSEKIEYPTKVQEAVYKKICMNQNLIVQSETGSGKTLAYLLPLFEKLKDMEKGMKVLILVPTHELAMQVHKQVGRLTNHSIYKVTSVTIFGDVNINRQVERLKEKPEIIIGTYGRILELIQKRKITAHTIKTIVLDEADKLLDKNNLSGIEAVIKSCMRDVQILCFSASVSKQTKEVAESIRNNFEFIKTSDTMEIPKNIQHLYFTADRRDKIELLRKIIKSIKPIKAMVFINNVEDIAETVQKLQYHQINADAIHGMSIKKDRQKVIDAFRTGKLQVLVATDIAARGLHFDDVTAVFHLSIMENPMDYLHRAGRTGRGKEKGISCSIVTKEEVNLLKNYQKAFGISFDSKKLYQGKVVRN